MNTSAGSKVLCSESAGLSRELSELSVAVLKTADALALVYNE